MNRNRNSSKKFAVVAGATGYLGRHVVKALHRDGWRVRAVARDPSRLGESIQYCEDVVVGQATQIETLPGLFDDVDVAFSSIGIRSFRRRPTFDEVDYGANAQLVDAAVRAGVRRFSFVSVLDGPQLRTLSPLVDARERVADLLANSPIESTVLRPTGFFNDMGDVFRMAARGKVWLIGSGNTRINPIHGADLADVIAAALEAPEPEPEISVGGPEVFSQREIGDLAFGILGREPRYGHISAALVRRLARWIRPLNRNASALAMMFSSLGDRDAVAPAVGSRHLEGFFRELEAA